MTSQLPVAKMGPEPIYCIIAVAIAIAITEWNRLLLLTPCDIMNKLLL